MSTVISEEKQWKETNMNLKSFLLSAWPQSVSGKTDFLFVGHYSGPTKYASVRSSSMLLLGAREWWCKWECQMGSATGPQEIL